jgi:hypothetical protein
MEDITLAFAIILQPEKKMFLSKHETSIQFSTEYMCPKVRDSSAHGLIIHMETLELPTADSLKKLLCPEDKHRP